MKFSLFKDNCSTKTSGKAQEQTLTQHTSGRVCRLKTKQQRSVKTGFKKSFVGGSLRLRILTDTELYQADVCWVTAVINLIILERRPGQEQRFMTGVSLRPSAVICGWIKTMLVAGALRSVIYTAGLNQPLGPGQIHRPLSEPVHHHTI